MGSLIERARTFCASLSFFTAFLACVAIAAAQGATVDVTGTVTADDGTAIAGASVTISGHGRAETVRTDARGHFSLSAVPSGTYALDAAAPGYATLSQRTVTINPTNATLDLVLSRATTNSLTVIGHVGTAAGQTVSTSSAPSVLLSAQDAAAAGVTQVSDMLWNQLATTPVLPLGGGGNATVTFALRGPDPTETLVDIDGHQVNNGNTGDFDLSLIDPAAMQDVQLVYGISPSSLVGPNTLGGAINILTLEPTTTPQGFVRGFGGSFDSFGETLQSTGTSGALGYAVSLHRATSAGSVNQSVFNDASETYQNVGSAYFGESMLTKLRYQLGGSSGAGYLQLDFRNQAVNKDMSATLTTFTPNGFTGGGGDDAIRSPDALAPFDESLPNGTFQSAAGTSLATHQSGYGLDAQIPIGGQKLGGAPATVLSFSHLTTVADQSVAGPLADSLPYLYNQRDLLGDDWLQIDHHFKSGELSFKYDLGTESLTTDFVQGQVTAELIPAPMSLSAAAAPMAQPADQETPPTQVIPISQTTRSAVLRYNGDPTTHIHYSLATYYSNYSTFGTSFDPRAGIVWTPTGNTAVRASIGTTFQTPQLSELVVPPPNLRVPVGGIIFIGNPNLKPDFATEYDLGAEQIFGKLGHQLHLSMDLYQSNLRGLANQLNVNPIPRCETKHNPTPCPLSFPVNAGNGIYSGIQLRAEQQLGSEFRLRAGWDVDSSYLTTVPASIQDGTLQPYQQSLGQPLHKWYLGLEHEPRLGLGYGAELDYQGTYNELNRSPYATLEAHAVWNGRNYQIGLYGTNLTNVYNDPFTILGGGILYGAVPGNPMIATDAYVLQGRRVVLVLTHSL
jgi:outer membrane receptor protein involved in Fe transport